MADSNSRSDRADKPEPLTTSDLDSRLDEALEESFPASDPVAITARGADQESGGDDPETPGDAQN